MTTLKHGAGTDAAFEICMNQRASRGAPWTQAQDAVLNDRALILARQTIQGWPGFSQTPLLDLPGLAAQLGVAALSYKDEGGRFGLGSFKALGGAYAVARLLQAQISQALGRPVEMSEVTLGAHPGIVSGITVCCATDGNHGRSVAWGARTFGARCVIFIHEGVSDARKTAIEAYGAEVRRCVGNYDDSVRQAQDTATSEGWFVVSDTSYPGYMDVPRDVMQGYEVMAAEAFDALPQPPTHIFLQTGVGGMAAAVTALAKRRWGDARPMVILCDPDQSACWLETYRQNAPTAVHGDLDTLMAGLACGEISALAWEILQDHADATIAVTDAAAVQAMRQLANPVGQDPVIVAGESAVAGLVGLTAGLSVPEAARMLGLGPQARVLVFGTEGDTDPELYQQLVGCSGAELRAGK